MLRITEKQQSFHSELYNKIPETHILKLIDKSVNFSFINDLLEESYCKNNGRPAKEPEMMMKLLFLQYIYNLSDVKVIEEATYNLAFLWFLGLNPEEKLPDASLLAKFRTHRLKEFSLDDIITDIVRQCVEKGLIKCDSISIDTTHIEANTIKKVPERVMKHLAKKIFKSLEEDNGDIPTGINTNIPDYNQIEDHNQAKQVMKDYLENVIEQAQPFANEKTKEAITEAKDILSDDLFILQKGLRSLVDKDARVGNKTKTSQFFGYKDEFMMTTDERIITSVAIHSGEYVDGKGFKSLLERTKLSGIKPNEIFGDKAYFRKDILDTIKENQAEAYIPVSASAYKIDEDLYSYNKDSDQWFCNMGNYTVQKKRKTRNKNGSKYDYLEFIFNKEQCINCKSRKECLGTFKGKAKKLTVSLNASEFYEISKNQKTEAFLKKYKKRSAHEWKNGEMKLFHGLSRAKGYGLESLSTQAKLTAIAVNLKRIAALYTLKTTAFLLQITILWKVLCLSSLKQKNVFRIANFA